MLTQQYNQSTALDPNSEGTSTFREPLRLFSKENPPAEETAFDVYFHYWRIVSTQY